jgi:hypothetical protein
MAAAQSGAALTSDRIDFIVKTMQERSVGLIK